MKRIFTAENTMDSVLGLIREAVPFLKENDASTRALFISELILEEMLTNIVKYAYDDTGPHEIEVVAEISGVTACLEVRDDGHVFDPLAVAPPLAGVSVQQQQVGGRGIHLVRTFVKEITYRREDGWNILTLIFPAKPV